MGELASRGQLNLSYFRWALITVPGVLLIGILSGRLSNAGAGNRWFDALAKPEAMPPGWMFETAWTLLYILLGLALALILNARGARLRGLAIGLFVGQFALNLAWSPVFFAAHQVTMAFWILVALLIAATATTIVFGRIRSAAAWLMLPYLAWLGFAAALNHDIDRLNPNAETLVPGGRKTQIIL